MQKNDNKKCKRCSQEYVRLDKNKYEKMMEK